MTNKYHNVLYTGCSSDIVKRVSQHKSHYFKGSFTDRYNCEYCVYFEEFPDISSAILREEQIKNMTRNEKLTLIATQSGKSWSPNMDFVRNRHHGQSR